MSVPSLDLRPAAERAAEIATQIHKLVSNQDPNPERTTLELLEFVPWSVLALANAMYKEFTEAQVPSSPIL